MGRRSSRRHWSFEERRAAVELSRVPECGMPGVASCLGIDPSEIYAWRRELREMAEAATSDEGATFLPAVIESMPIEPERGLLPATLVQVAMDVGGVPIMVAHGASPDLVSGVIDALTRAR